MRPWHWLAIPGAESALAAGADVSLAATSLGFGGLVLWAVPAFALTVPGLLVVLIVTLQVGGGLAWLPVARRRIGAFGLRATKANRRPKDPRREIG